MQKIDRKAASRLLKVSIRTVDRYIRAKKLSIQEKDGRIWLNKSQIIKLRAHANSRQDVDTSTPKMSIDKSVSTPVDMSIDTVHFVSTSDSPIKSHRRQNTDETVYKKLFEELRAELQQKQERLEGANYRVGQLEALLKDTIPRLDYQRALNAEKAAKEEISRNLETVRLQSTQLESKLKEQTLDKRVYLVILFIIMLLQPLWLILSLR